MPLATLAGTVAAASGKTGFQKLIAGAKNLVVALIANGLGACSLLRNWWSGAALDHLRDGPLDKHGSGSRILDVTAEVNEASWHASPGFGKDRPDPSGGSSAG